MYEQLPILLQLQEIDGEIDKLKSLKAEIPVELQTLETELAEYREKFQAKSDALEELQKERRSKDRQLDIQQAKLEKYKSQRLSVKTNKEYTALESEIADLEEASSMIEDEILELMISIDEATDGIEAAKNELKLQEDALNKKRAIFLSERAKLDQQLGEWYEKRGGSLGEVDSALMGRYDNWRERRGSSLVAVIVGQSCDGCHLTLPPQLVNEVRKGKELHTCNSCGRILYWEGKGETADSREA